MGAEGWYVRRGTQVKGPFPARVIAVYRARGKLRDGDEVSPDLQSWRPLGELGRAPRAVTGPAAAAAGSASASTVRTNEMPAPAPPLAPRSVYVERLLRQRDNRWLQGGAVAVLLAGILAAGLSLDSGDGVEAADCNAAPGPAINWSSCSKDAARLAGLDLQHARLRATRLRDADLKGANLAGVDLAYAELGEATLAYANLRGASLKGATLAAADLSYVDLAGADLSYADLGRARMGGANLDQALLDNAIWVDGRVCGEGSVGRCR